MKKEKIQPNQLVAILPPEGEGGKAWLFGITLGPPRESAENPEETIWSLRYGYHSGLTNLRLPAKRLLPIKVLSIEEMLSEAYPAGFQEIHPERAFEKYFKEIKPRLLEICDQLDLEMIAKGFPLSKQLVRELKKLPCKK